ncbi:MAG: heparinase II/III family protein [Armatimonadetes bacterium]|nr:heparinase II/III family protein [Armatimonadota bacterium]
MLADRFGESDLAGHLVPLAAWRPYPRASDRDGWGDLEPARAAALVAAGEARLSQPWPVLLASVFAEFRRTGNRSHWEQPQFARRSMLSDLVLAECVEGRGRFLDAITDGVWLICEESFWGVSAHNWGKRWPDSLLPDTAERIIDLFAGETGGLLAWTLYLLGDQLTAVHPVITDRIRRELDERIITPYLERDDFGWMGLQGGWVNNWNPWCASNCLTVALLAEQDEPRRGAAAAKTLRIIERFVAMYHADGGCDEGTSYWGRAGASFFDCLDLLDSATAGWLNVWSDPLVGNMGRYLYRCHIDRDWYVNFADGGARVGVEAPLLCRYGRKIGDSALVDLGVYADHLRRAGHEPPLRITSMGRRLPELFDCPELAGEPRPAPYIAAAWLDGIEMLTARSEPGSAQGLFLAAKGGHNAESHNHNDVGQFIVFQHGQPAIIDLGVETYTAHTFSPRRYEIWTMQSAWHNLPTLGGVQQSAGRQFAAREVSAQVDDDRAELRLDLAGAYPTEAGLRAWHRTTRLERGDQPRVVVHDTFELAEPREVQLSVILAREPRLTPTGCDLAGEAPLSIAWPTGVLNASIEAVEVTDDRLRPVWGERVWRLLLTTTGAVERGDWTMTVG